jgi:hypothetical protein
MVQWRSGDENGQQIVKLDDMTTWVFYDDEDQWHAAWDNSAQLKVS